MGRSALSSMKHSDHFATAKNEIGEYHDMVAHWHDQMTSVMSKGAASGPQPA
jgi:hypothetical protein